MSTVGLEEVVNVIDRQEWLEHTGKTIQRGMKKLRKEGFLMRVKDFLHGVWLGHPLHPVLTDIPIGAWTASLALDTAEAVTGKKELGAGADLALAVGMAGAAGAAVTGLVDWQHAAGRTRRVGLMHAILNTTALGLYAGSMLARKSKNRSLGFGMALAGYAAMLAGAYLGGDMVYEQEMGVDHAPDKQLPTEYVEVMAEADLMPDQLTRVYANHIPILLVKRNDRIYALAETCAHLGGPLAEGELTDDNTVICPWHASQFRLEDGSIVRGPSTYAQPCLDVQVINGQIAVAFRKE